MSSKLILKKNLIEYLVWLIPIKSIRNSIRINSIYLKDLGYKINYNHYKESIKNKKTFFIRNDWDVNEKDFINNYFYNLIKNNYINDLEISYNPDIEFFAPIGKRYFLEKSKAKIKIFYTGECVSKSTINKIWSQYSDNCINDVDLSLGFDMLDENKYTNMDWWNSFNDKYLSENLEKLYKNNYDLKNAALKIKENEQMVKMQFAQELPFLSLTGELSRDFQAPRQQYGSMMIPKYSQYNYNIPLSAGYEIDIWGKNRLKTKSKKQQLEIIKQMERATYISLSGNFAADYFNLIKADKLIELQKELIDTQEEILSKTRQKYNSGLCSINEVLEAQKLLTILKEEYNTHIKTRDVLIESLKIYLADENDKIKRNSFENTKLMDDLPLKYNSDIVSKRPDYIEQEANLKRLGFDIRVARKEFLPSFVIFGQIGLNAYHLSSLFNSPSQFFNAGILPSWDLFSGGRKIAFLKMKKTQYEQALNDYQKTYITGVTDINSNLIEYKTALENYKEVSNRIKTDEKIYNLIKDKRKIGSANDLDVLYAKEVYLSTKIQETSNKINSIISSIGLSKALGGINPYSSEKI